MKDWSEQMSGMNKKVSDLIRLLNDSKHEEALLLVVTLREELARVREVLFDKMDYKLFDTVEFYNKK